jgi:hypothetical protein
MSQYERRRRGNALPGDGSRLPSGGNTRAGRRGSGHLAVSLGYLGGRLDKTGDTQMTALGDEAVGKPGVAGVYTNQRLSLSTTWEGPRLICRGFKPDSGNLTVRDYRGASGNVSHGGTVNPSCNRKSRNGNPSPTAGRARFLSQLSSRQGWKSGRVKVPAPSIACIRTVSISGVCGGNEAQ